MEKNRVEKINKVGTFIAAVLSILGIMFLISFPFWIEKADGILGPSVGKIIFGMF